MEEHPSHSTAPLETPIEPLRWIGGYKLAKAVLALIAGLMVLRLMHRDLPELALKALAWWKIEPESHIGTLVLRKIIEIKDKRLEWVAVGLFLYAPLTFAEGLGLILRKYWAEWLTVITTAGLIPLEIREVFHRVTWLRILILILNVLVVIYLIVRLRRDPGVHLHLHAPAKADSGQSRDLPPPSPQSDAPG